MTCSGSGRLGSQWHHAFHSHVWSSGSGLSPCQTLGIQQRQNRKGHCPYGVTSGEAGRQIIDVQTNKIILFVRSDI